MDNDNNHVSSLYRTSIDAFLCSAPHRVCLVIPESSVKSDENLMFIEPISISDLGGKYVPIFLKML